MKLEDLPVIGFALLILGFLAAFGWYEVGVNTWGIYVQWWQDVLVVPWAVGVVGLALLLIGVAPEAKR